MGEERMPTWTGDRWPTPHYVMKTETPGSDGRALVTTLCGRSGRIDPSLLTDDDLGACGSCLRKLGANPSGRAAALPSEAGPEGEP